MSYFTTIINSLCKNHVVSLVLKKNQRWTGKCISKSGEIIGFLMVMSCMDGWI